MGTDVPPFWVLGTLIALLYAALYKLLLPQGSRSMLVCAAVALVGFFLGNYLAGLLGITLLRLGELNLLGASLVTFGGLAIANLQRP